MANSASSNELHSITKHNNIVISGVGANEVLKFDGSNWINQTLPEAGIAALSGAAFTGAITGVTALTVDNLNLNGNTLLANSGAVNITPAAGSAIVLDGTINVDAGVVTGATSITSTEFHGGGGNLTGISAGTALTGSTSNTITTVTGANAIVGEANLTFDGTNLTVGTGNVIIGTAGKGIDFSAATPNESGAGSASNSVLDNYEEVTWTPERWDNSESDSESQTYHNRQGVYTLIGNHVFLNMSWNPNAKGNLTDSQAMTIGGIPFTPSGPANIRFSGSIGYPTSLVLGGAYMPIARIDDGANKIQLHLLANGGGQIPLTIAHFGSDSIIDVTIDYTIA